MRTIIHVNQHVVRKNAKTGATDPCLTVKTTKTNTYAHEVVVTGPCRIVYRPDAPLSCGARVWIETESTVIPVRDGEYVLPPACPVESLSAVSA